MGHPQSFTTLGASGLAVFGTWGACGTSLHKEFLYTGKRKAPGLESRETWGTRITLRTLLAGGGCRSAVLLESLLQLEGDLSGLAALDVTALHHVEQLAIA